PRERHLAGLHRAAALILGGSQYRLLDGLRQSDRAEEPLRIEIILSRFINDPEKSVLCRVWVGERDVDFALLQRCRIAVIVDASDELLCFYSCHGLAFKSGCLIFDSLPPIPAPSYQCSSATRTEPSAIPTADSIPRASNASAAGLQGNRASFETP